MALNITQTKELLGLGDVLDFRQNRPAPTPQYIKGEHVERVDSSIKFLGVHISADLSWSVNTTVLIKKAEGAQEGAIKHTSCW